MIGILTACSAAWVISRRYATMAEALTALPPVLVRNFGKVSFFAVNQPQEGVHVLLGIVDNPADLEFALNAVNSRQPGDFMAVTNLGKFGGFYGS